MRLYWCLSMFIDVYGEFGKSYRTGICSKYSDAFQHCWRTTLTKVGLGVWRTARGHRSSRQNSDEFWRSMTQINRSSTTFRNLGDQAARILDTYFTGTTPWMFFFMFWPGPICSVCHHLLGNGYHLGMGLRWQGLVSCDVCLQGR